MGWRRSTGRRFGVVMFSFFMFLLSCNLIGEHRARKRMGMTFMTSKASHFRMTFKVVLIYGNGHFHHFAGGFLLFLSSASK